MPGPTEAGKLFITHEVDTSRLRREMDKSEKVVEQSAKRMSKTTADGGPFGSKFTQAAFKAVAVMGTVELGLKGLTAASEAFTGDMQGAAEAIKSMPAGIGPVAQAIEGVLGRVTGITTEIEAMQRRQQMIDLSLGITRGVFGRQGAAEKGLGEIERLLDRQQQINRAFGQEEKAALEAKFAQEDKQRSLEEQLEIIRTSARLHEKESDAFQKMKDRLERVNEELRKFSSLFSFSIRMSGTEFLFEDRAARFEALEVEKRFLEGEIERVQAAGGRSDLVEERVRKLQERLKTISFGGAVGGGGVSAAGVPSARQISINRELGKFHGKRDVDVEKALNMENQKQLDLEMKAQNERKQTNKLLKMILDAQSRGKIIVPVG